MDTNTINQKALELLDQAMFTSSAIKDKERRSGEVKTDHIYPLTKEETEKIAALLNQAFEAADDTEDPEFRQKYDQLMEIVRWSNAKHRTWSWAIIAGVLIPAALFLWGVISQQKDIKENKAEMAVVKDWPKADTLITWETAMENSPYNSDAYKSPNAWKAQRLGLLKKWNIERTSMAEEFVTMADTASSKDAKKQYKAAAKKHFKEADDFREQFDKLAAASFKDTQKIAVDTYKGFIRSNRSDANFFMFFFILLALLIALYVWTGNPYGYELSRTRVRDKVLSWIRKAGFWIAGTCFGAGLAAQLFAPDIIWKYSDGHTERETDVAGTAGNVIWKIALMFIGIVVFVGISLFIMCFEAFGGLPEKIRELKARQA